MRDLTKNERIQRAIGGLKAFEAFITNMDEEHVSDTACETFASIIKDVETVEEQLREEDGRITIHLPDGMLGAVKHDNEEEQ